VVAIDLTPELFDAGRAWAAECGVEVEWQEADAEDLPYPDAAFDTVLREPRPGRRRGHSSQTFTADELAPAGTSPTHPK
jgi:hypothetical protein